MAEGAATKIVVPTSMQDMAATLTNVKEMLKEK
jgi:hypothetical protein